MIKILSKNATSGIKILGIQKDDRIQWLVSQHDPQKEAERLIQSSVPGEFCILFGWGSGFAAQVALEKYSRVLVIEPSALKTPDFSNEINRISCVNQNRLDIIWWDITQEETILRTSLSPYLFSLLSSKLVVIPLPGYHSAFPKQSRVLKTLISSSIEESTKDFGIFQVFGNLWLENYIRNIPTILAKENTTGLFLQKFQQARKSVQQIVALGAGPSFNEGIDWLKNQVKSTLVIAADTCAPGLVGLENPHLHIILISLDAQWYTHLHSRWIPQSNFLGWILDASVSPRIFRSIDSFFAIFSNHPLVLYLDALQIDPERTKFFHSQSGLAALETAQSLSNLDSKPLEIFGFDGMFLDYRAYGSGTYLDPWLLSKNKREISRDTQDLTLMSRGKAQSISWSPAGYRSKYYTDHLPSEFGSKLLQCLTTHPKFLFSKKDPYDCLIRNLLEDLSIPYRDPTNLHTNPSVSLVLPGAIKLYQQHQSLGSLTMFSALELNREYLFSRIGKLSKV